MKKPLADQDIGHFEKISESSYFAVDFSSITRIAPSTIGGETKILSQPWTPVDYQTITVQETD